MSTDDPISPNALAALRDRFQQQSRRAQAYYNVMHAARQTTGGDDAAGAWMNAPLSSFEDRTPAQLVEAGREDEVLAYLAAQR